MKKIIDAKVHLQYFAVPKDKLQLKHYIELDDKCIVFISMGNVIIDIKYFYMGKYSSK